MSLNTPYGVFDIEGTLRLTNRAHPKASSQCSESLISGRPRLVDRIISAYG